jgi:hypothetical protein
VCLQVRSEQRVRGWSREQQTLAGEDARLCGHDDTMSSPGVHMEEKGATLPISLDAQLFGGKRRAVNKREKVLCIKRTRADESFRVSPAFGERGQPLVWAPVAVLIAPVPSSCYQFPVRHVDRRQTIPAR